MAVYAIRRYRAAKNAWCWWVNFRRRGLPYDKRFYDLKHGGSRAALEAAVRWRDKQLRRYPPLTMREFHAQTRSNNTSGAPGVHFLTPRRQPEGVWQARIKLRDGRKLHRTFSVRKFGDTEAFARAVAARDDLVALVDERVYLKHRTARRACR